jgi:hypothetical protein
VSFFRIVAPACQPFSRTVWRAEAVRQGLLTRQEIDRMASACEHQDVGVLNTRALTLIGILVGSVLRLRFGISEAVEPAPR